MSIELTLDEILKVLPEGKLDGDKHVELLRGVAALDKRNQGISPFWATRNIKIKLPPLQPHWYFFLGILLVFLKTVSVIFEWKNLRTHWVSSVAL